MLDFGIANLKFVFDIGSRILQIKVRVVNRSLCRSWCSRGERERPFCVHYCNFSFCLLIKFRPVFCAVWPDGSIICWMSGHLQLWKLAQIAKVSKFRKNWSPCFCAIILNWFVLFCSLKNMCFIGQSEIKHSDWTLQITCNQSVCFIPE